MKRGQNIQSLELCCTDEGTAPGFVEHAKHYNDITVLRLRDELGDDPDVIQCPLCVCIAHGTKKEVGIPESPGMVPSVLRPGNSMQIYVNADTILASPFDSTEEIAGNGGRGQVNTRRQRKEILTSRTPWEGTVHHPELQSPTRL